MGLCDLEYSRDCKIREKEQAETDKAAAEEKVERLKAAYTRVNRVYDQVKWLQSEVKKQEKTGAEWTGRTSKGYTGYVAETFAANYRNYKNRLDEIQDSINRELTRQENKVLSLSGDIFGLAQAINSLWNEIQNWANNF